MCRLVCCRGARLAGSSPWQKLILTVRPPKQTDLGTKGMCFCCRFRLQGRGQTGAHPGKAPARPEGRSGGRGVEPLQTGFAGADENPDLCPGFLCGSGVG